MKKDMLSVCVCEHSQRTACVILCDQVCRAERKVVIEPR